MNSGENGCSKTRRQTKKRGKSKRRDYIATKMKSSWEKREKAKERLKKREGQRPREKEKRELKDRVQKHHMSRGETNRTSQGEIRN